jgi:hypothetical protein
MTIRHAVCFRFHPDTTDAQVEALASGLRELPSILPEIVDYRVGADLGINEASWDLALTADFADQDDYLAYRDHPEHLERIRTLVVPITAERVSVQFQI